MSWLIMNGSAPGRPRLRPRLPPATGRRGWPRCSARRRSPGRRDAAEGPRRPGYGHRAENGAGAAAAVGASPAAGELVADVPGAGGPGRAVADRLHRPGRGPRPGPDAAARAGQAAGLAAEPARG